MAGGKLSARQKMINLMYLVFIAMMAMQIDREVLNSFGLFNRSFLASNEKLDTQNTAALAALQVKAAEQAAKYGDVYQKAQQVKAASDKLYSEIQAEKDFLLSGMEDKTDFVNMKKSAKLDEHWFTGDRNTKQGDEFVANVDAYRNGMIAILGEDSSLLETVKGNFGTGQVTTSKGKTEDWLEYNFKGYPQASSVAKLTKMQNDIKVAESEILANIYTDQLVSEVSMTNYQAIVVPEKTAFFSGENFKGKVVLGRFDNTLNFEKVIINGREVDSNVAGQVELNFPAGNVGTKNINGELQFKEGDSIVSIPVKSEYAVINRPNSATISADKMNVVYRGVANPMTISFAGISDNNVTASAPGLSSKGGSSYVMNPGQGREVTINVTGKLPDGGGTVSDQKVFRIKGIPRPTGTVRGDDSGQMKMSKASLVASPIGAALPDFDFDLNLTVNSFKIRAGDAATVQVQGGRLNAQAKRAVERAKRGSTVQIFDINASIQGNSGYKLPKVSPVFIELTN